VKTSFKQCLKLFGLDCCLLADATSTKIFDEEPNRKIQMIDNAHKRRNNVYSMLKMKMPRSDDNKVGENNLENFASVNQIDSKLKAEQISQQMVVNAQKRRNNVLTMLKNNNVNGINETNISAENELKGEELSEKMMMNAAPKQGNKLLIMLKMKEKGGESQTSENVDQSAEDSENESKVMDTSSLLAEIKSSDAENELKQTQTELKEEQKLED
jgi:hypothetical protein